MRESRARSLAKSLSWRVIATLTTIALVWGFTGQVRTAVAVGGVEVFTKLVIFYFHERTWEAVAWGIVDAAGARTRTARDRVQNEPGSNGIDWSAVREPPRRARGNRPRVAGSQAGRRKSRDRGSGTGGEEGRHEQYVLYHVGGERELVAQLMEGTVEREEDVAHAHGIEVHDGHAVQQHTDVNLESEEDQVVPAGAQKRAVRTLVSHGGRSRPPMSAGRMGGLWDS